VLKDLRPYFKLMNEEADRNNMEGRLIERVAQMEGMEGEESPDDPYMLNQHINTNPQNYQKKVTSLKVLRWRFVQHKINRLLGVYTDYDKDKKMDLVNRIYSVFL
jgi:hypothetical protein